MVKFIVFLLLLDLCLVTLQKSDRKEVTLTFPVSAPIQLKCDDDLKVNNINLTINRIKTSCLSTIKDCTLPIEAIETIKKSCNKQESCEVDIRSITNNHNCLQEYGYFNFWYACKTKIDFSCDFKSSLCNWKPANNLNRFRWVRGRRFREPYNDHTSASPSGSYVYISSSSRSSTGDIAKLESGHIIATNQQCFSFWYFTTNSRDSVHVLQNENHLLGLSTDQYEKRKWHHIRISLNKTLFYSYHLVFKVTRGNYYDGLFGAIVVDDILIENKNCDSFIIMCDFDTSSCGWNDQYATNYIWKKQNGKTRSSYRAPSIDHSTTSGNGYYLHLNSSNDVATTAYYIFNNLDIRLSGNSCLTFWYNMYIYRSNVVYRKEGINVSIDDKIVWTKFRDQDNKWIKAAIDLDVRKIYNIQIIGFLGRYSGKHISIDDISLTVGTCAGLINHEEICVDMNDDISIETYCPKGYFDITNARLSFDPEKNECSEHYKKTRTRLLQECKDEDDYTQKCSIDLSTDVSAKPECFQLHEFTIRHTCEAKKSTKVSPVVTSNRDSAAEDFSTISPAVTSIGDSGEAEDSSSFSPVVTPIRDSDAEDSTTVSPVVTSFRDSGAVTVKGAALPTNVNASSDSEIGFVAGSVVAGLLLICLVILIVVLVRRHIKGRGSNEKVRNELRGNDYIGCQDIALPHTAGRSNQQNVGMYGQKSSSNTTSNTQINNVQHTCSNIGTYKEFQSPPNAARRGETFADNQTSNGDEYAIVGPIAETSFSKTIHSRTGTSDSALLSEPTVTGLNITQLSKTSTGYEFAKPVLETENKIDDEDQYALSEEGVYDHLGNNRHKELEDNIYNHAVDNIYDSGSHKRNDDDKEDTYDHFIGQKTEDDYDITTTT